jgi:hypothetical protein
VAGVVGKLGRLLPPVLMPLLSPLLRGGELEQRRRTGGAEFKGSEMVEIGRVEFDRGGDNYCGRSGGGGEKNPSLYFNQDLEERRGEIDTGVEATVITVVERRQTGTMKENGRGGIQGV